MEWYVNLVPYTHTHTRWKKNFLREVFCAMNSIVTVFIHFVMTLCVFIYNNFPMYIYATNVVTSIYIVLYSFSDLYLVNTFYTKICSKFLIFLTKGTYNIVQKILLKKLQFEYCSYDTFHCFHLCLNWVLSISEKMCSLSRKLYILII